MFKKTSRNPTCPDSQQMTIKSGGGGEGGGGRGKEEKTNRQSIASAEQYWEHRPISVMHPTIPAMVLFVWLFHAVTRAAQPAAHARLLYDDRGRGWRCAWGGVMHIVCDLIRHLAPVDQNMMKYTFYDSTGVTQSLTDAS